MSTGESSSGQERRGEREGLAENEMLTLRFDYIGNFLRGKEREGRTSCGVGGGENNLCKGMGL